MKKFKRTYLPIFRNDQFRVILTIVGITVSGILFLIGIMISDSMKNKFLNVIDELSDTTIVYNNIQNKDINYLNKINNNKSIVPFESTSIRINTYREKQNYEVKIRIIGTNNNFVMSYIPYEDGVPTSVVKGLEGRVWSREESEQNMNVIVITRYTSMVYFGESNPIGKRINLTGYGSYTVVGVLNDLKEYYDSYSNVTYRDNKNITPMAHIFMPINTYKKSEFNYMEGVTKQLVQDNELASSIKDSLDKSSFKSRYEDSYTRMSLIEQYNENQRNTQVVYTMGFIGLVLFSIVIIVNTMLFSIKSRMNEIGIRITLGATKFDITKQFIVETLLLACISLIISITFIYLIIAVLNIGFIKNITFVVFSKSLIKYVIGFIFVVVFASIIPAKYASKINVIDTLRIK
ncbi:ABC transporter permease [Haploplasma axanthum]|uniref:Macrolide export ATP-binding/permease protein MacB n=1 Tax=Haploplasma axanthum TaxID=29552 RepID=A0A449BFV2_HAPAX|nr:ABC transporter permease [Haploplasma axanthum]VEU81180.1 Macrolide export ATP-binding/permease protein MacB [Haploplasma axanthum]